MDDGFDNRISLQKLEVFCLVVELGGVGRAAEHLFVAQPVVSAHLRTLQERLGAQLLYRDGRRMRLTEAGDRAYAWATETLSRTRELVRELDGLSDGRRGSVVVAASMSVGSYLLPPILAEFRRAHPQAEITLNISDPEHATAAAAAGECDFAVLVAEAPPEAPLLSSVRAGYERFVLVAPPDFEPHGPIRVAELDRLPLVASPRSHVRRAIADHQLQRFGVDPKNITIELGHPEAMKRAAQDGLGAALLFRSSVAAELKAGSLTEIEIADADLGVSVFVVMRRSKRFTQIQEDLLTAVREALAHQLEQESPGLPVTADTP